MWQESEPTTTKRKRKERNEEKPSNRAYVKVGDRVKAKFDDGVWYEGSVRSVKRGKVGEVVRVEIDFDDGTNETYDWPDTNIILIDGGGKIISSKKSMNPSKSQPV